ncbi:AvrD family protein [Streptomyces sp. AcE210]|uniref:AvrD family protein n=1 Tax=Streptomyces sp. AcE210 TaxID=2292703 RepID=UPI000E302690|nr:AvrD family protein [Streptomyces sp. AcE210]RFC71506.1 hypothetical protein DXZ75_30995 [Streptomyces sp. AcE210]
MSLFDDYRFRLGEMATYTHTREQRHHKTVDDYLGPGEKRFFGKGYKRAEQRLEDITVETSPDGAGVVRCRASVRYPQDWSRKGKRDQAPHLSSIDVLLIAGEVAELYLTHALGLDARGRAELRLRRVRMKAGNSPVEEELDEFDITATIRPVDASGPRGRAVTAVNCQVGALRALCEIEHPVGVPRSTPGRYADPDEVLGSAEHRPFGAAHKAKSQNIRELVVDSAASRARAVVSARHDVPEQPVVQGLESYSHRATSLIDGFVAAIQLGQILLYELDEVSRAESNTLWMRQSLIEVSDTERVITAPAPLSVHLEETQLITDRSGATWRTADIVGELRHMSFRCSATHRLPQRPLRGTEND